MTFGEKLHSIREKKGLTQEALAMRARLSVGTIRNYEQGIRIALFPAVVKIAAALGVTCDSFADCTDIADGEKPAPAKAKRRAKK
ncbi:MAG TPA: helix-turn-helix transcriptional regulator [Gemmataceae bacterium]|jgi:transcriptional regulator with XRE-family HTH domain|nr:helix-turn-helix transcriptional regulator [Gemmataceae bacterium]